MLDNLNDDNFMIFAIKAYEKPNMVQSEFDDDLNRLLYLKRLLTKYYATGVLKDRLIMNHIVVLYNVFGKEAATKMLFFKFDEKDYEVIKPFLLFLRLLPETVNGINGKTIKTGDIKLDQEAVRCLQKLRT